MNTVLERLGNTRLDRRRLLQTAGAAAVVTATRPFEGATAGPQATETSAAFELTSNSLVAAIEELHASEGRISMTQFRKVVEDFVNNHPNTIEVDNGEKQLSLPVGADGVDRVELGLTTLRREPYTGYITCIKGERPDKEGIRLDFSIHNETTSVLSGLEYPEAVDRIYEIADSYPGTDLFWTFGCSPEGVFMRSLVDVVGDWRPDLRPALEVIREAELSGGNSTWETWAEALNADAVTTIADEWMKRYVANVFGFSAEEIGLENDQNYHRALASFSYSPEKMKAVAYLANGYTNIIRDSMLLLNYGVPNPSQWIPYEPQVSALPEMTEAPEAAEMAETVFSRRGLPDNLGDNLLKLAQTFSFLQSAETEELPVFNAVPEEVFELQTVADLKPEPLSLTMRAEAI